MKATTILDLFYICLGSWLSNECEKGVLKCSGVETEDQAWQTVQREHPGTGRTGWNLVS